MNAGVECMELLRVLAEKPLRLFLLSGCSNAEGGS
jgi:hypothetical protein